MTSAKWKIKNSLWIVLAFIPFLSGLAFIYAGFKVEKKLWLYIGIFYSIIWSIWVVLMEVSQEIGESFGGFSVMFWFVGMFYVFIVLREYLVRLEAIEQTQKSFREKIFEEYTIKNKNEYFENLKENNEENFTNQEKNTLNSSTINNNIEENFENQENGILGSKLVDINKDSESVLSELPGINLILAKKIVELRLSGYEFSSVEDLTNKLNLKPHIIEKLRPLVEFSPIKRKKRKGRKVDI